MPWRSIACGFVVHAGDQLRHYGIADLHGRRAERQDPDRGAGPRSHQATIARTRSRARTAEAGCRATRKLKAEIAAIGQDRTKLNQQLIDIAGRVRDVESQISDTEGRLRPLDARELQIRASLESAVTKLRRCLRPFSAPAAGRRAALIVRPEDALQSLRTAMLLGAVVPEMRARAAQLASDLGELVALRKNISEERDRLATDRDRLNSDRIRLAALVQERQKNQADAERIWRRSGSARPTSRARLIPFRT